ncbi:hypothetical protein FAES_3959 [Fibrella aestuarina BUZ 2]|uniref:Intein C-terminal splicing domain-containing protein n=1 Tax=Fibrella aestuarina BUZ 2 TaxID=1166018 RepID=I0KCV9_9BACT|nr:hypothetical protein [Fibrella aestuarina]CCH01962.1 hypothetical protein FAES_3959 [Fibrella aestuarina BUZ 2]
MTPVQQQQLYAQLVAPFDQQCRVARRLVQQAMTAMLDRLITVLESGKSIDDVLLLLPGLITDEAHQTLLNTLYLRGGIAASLQPEPTIEAVRRCGAKAAAIPGMKRAKEPQPPASLRLRLLSLVRDLTGAGRVVKLTNRTRNLVANALAVAADLGSTTRSIIRRLRGVLLEPNRVSRIAQTETLRGWNAGSEWLAETRGKTTKRWLPVLDGRTRDAHALMASQPPIKIRDLFVVGGMVMRYPGDPAGGAKNVINCFLPHERTFVDKKRIKKVFRSWYEGDIVTIYTSGKRQFTCTPNHPILTTDGWVKAGELTKAHKLVKSGFGQRVTTGDLDVKHQPATFQEIFESALITGVRVGVGGLHMNFYGDMPTGDVDVIDTSGLLGRRWQPSFVQVVGNLILKSADEIVSALSSHSPISRNSSFSRWRQSAHAFVRFGNDLKQLFVSRLLKSSHIRLAGVAALDPVVSQNAGNDISIDAVLASQRQLARTRSIMRHYLRIGKNDSRGLAPVSTGIDSMLPQGSPDSHTADPVLVGDLRYGNVGPIQSDHIVNLRWRPDYSGHVYTLETEDGLYDINTYVARNCRCMVYYQ